MTESTGRKRSKHYQLKQEMIGELVSAQIWTSRCHSHQCSFYWTFPKTPEPQRPCFSIEFSEPFEEFRFVSSPSSIDSIHRLADVNQQYESHECSSGQKQGSYSLHSSEIHCWRRKRQLSGGELRCRNTHRLHGYLLVVINECFLLLLFVSGVL